jgi:hypothetical protein
MSIILEREFKILVYVDKVPSMASCTKCHRKFFTPRWTFPHDPRGAELYLMERFMQHRCPEDRVR